MEKIESISIDIETYSDRDLKKCGVYKYAESPNAELLLFGYSINNGPVTVIDVAQGEEVPEYILKALTDDNIIKWAYNASFERIFLSVWLKRNYPQYFVSYSIDEDTVSNYLDPSAWRCSLVWGAVMGLPLSLKGIGAVLMQSHLMQNCCSLATPSTMAPSLLLMWLREKKYLNIY